MVMEMQMKDGTWEAFMADHFPDKLDDEIKKVHEAFYLSAQKLEPEQLKDVLPMSLPMTYLYEGDGEKHFGIA
eukprot:12922564-Prorocentrum_lima.AAC.1